MNCGRSPGVDLGGASTVCPGVGEAVGHSRRILPRTLRWKVTRADGALDDGSGVPFRGASVGVGDGDGSPQIGRLAWGCCDGGWNLWIGKRNRKVLFRRGTGDGPSLQRHRNRYPYTRGYRSQMLVKPGRRYLRSSPRRSRRNDLNHGRRKRGRW